MRARAAGLPSGMRQRLLEARRERGWTQAELGRRAGLPQMHISAIETGRVVPRFDTLLDLARVLGYDLLLVPRDLVPVISTLAATRDSSGAGEGDERPLYEPDEDEDPSS